LTLLPKSNPIKGIVSFSQRNPGALLLFITEKPFPMVISIFQGNPYFWKADETTGMDILSYFSEKQFQSLVQMDCSIAYLFCEDTQYNNFTYLSRIISDRAGRLLPAVYVSDLVGFIRKDKKPAQKAHSITVIYDAYSKNPDLAMNVEPVVEFVTDWCKNGQYANSIVNAEEMETAEDLLFQCKSSDMLIFFAHGFTGEKLIDHSIRFSNFKFSIKDLYANPRAFSNKFVCLCCCGMGRDSQDTPKDIMSLGQIISVLGAKMVYCPVTEFFANDAVHRVRDFFGLVERKVVEIPQDWRVLM
jgi:hypothetical protein